MALLQLVLTLVTRWAGRILNTVFSWATEMVFGKVPESRQLYISLIVFASVAWMIFVLGIFFPGIATFLLAFVPLTDWVTEQRVRIGMMIAAVILPLLIGLIALFLHNPASRPQHMKDRLIAVVTGYPYTVGLSLTFLLMLIFAPVLKIRALLRRWNTQYVPMVVASKDYLTTVEEIQTALRENGWETRAVTPHWMMRVPTKLLARFTGGAIENMVADELTTREGNDLEVILHPSSLVINGPERAVMRIRATVVKQLTFSNAYMTWTEKANELEEELDTLWRKTRNARGDIPEEAMEHLRALEAKLERVEIDFEEWEILFREFLLVERGLLRVRAGIEWKPHEPVDGESPSNEKVS